ncbi:MAG: LOG family protein [Nitrospirota bacterium]|nr:LOG family protein [Nitrospirota bacterium]
MGDTPDHSDQSLPPGKPLSNPGKRHHRRREDPAEAARKWDALMARLAELEAAPNGDLLRGLLNTVCRFFEGDAERRDLKLAHYALKESRQALEVFAQYRHVPKISIFGSARTESDHPDYVLARDFAHRMATHGYMSITGAGGGIMEAANLGAGREMSFGVNIDLPFEQYANEFIDGDPKLVQFRFFFTRKLYFMKESTALALFPGGYGTLDEGFEALTLIQTGKSTPMPIVLMEHPGGEYWSDWLEYVENRLLARGMIHRNDLDLFRICHTVEEAVEEVLRFFRVFHSAVRTRDGVAIWLWRALEDEELEQLNESFEDLLGGGKIRQPISPGMQVSDTETDVMSFIEVPMDHRHQGRLRQLIDAINRL